VLLADTRSQAAFGETVRGLGKDGVALEYTIMQALDWLNAVIAVLAAILAKGWSLRVMAYHRD
jgi:hypothetical protein